MKVKITINGPKVINVGYRAVLLERAEILEIPYFTARNINDKNRVEALVGGDKEKVEAFIEFAKREFPEGAKVTEVSVEGYDGEIRPIEAFYPSFSASQLSKIVRTGIDILKNQEKGFSETLGKQDKMLEKQDISLGKQDLMIGKQDSLQGVVERGFKDLKDEHIKTRETLKEIIYSEAHGLKRELGSVRSAVEGIRKGNPETI